MRSPLLMFLDASLALTATSAPNFSRRSLLLQSRSGPMAEAAFSVLLSSLNSRVSDRYRYSAFSRCLQPSHTH